VKDAKVLVLDEATASVDYETDRNIQDTITHEFADKTLLCIARESVSFRKSIPFDLCTDRLATIIAYDRICVMDAGQIAVREMFLIKFLV
jgi:ABC-type multidrug transport system fused ATPase/permease subunit